MNTRFFIGLMGLLSISALLFLGWVWSTAQTAPLSNPVASVTDEAKPTITGPAIQETAVVTPNPTAESTLPPAEPTSFPTATVEPVTQATATPLSTERPAERTFPLEEWGYTRIQFEPGAVSATISGELSIERADRYIFQAREGQFATIELTNQTGVVGFNFYGLQDGQPLHRAVNERPIWEGMLPGSQDYVIHILTPEEHAAYDLILTINPLISDQQSTATDVGTAP